MGFFAVASLLLVAPAAAKDRARMQQRPQEQAHQASPAPKAKPIKALLAEAKALYEALEYDRVIPLAQEVLRRPEATVYDQLDAYLLEGSALAIVGSSVEAEKPFRFLLRGRPDYDMPPDTAPKIVAIFRKVQVEERAIRTQMRELERQQVLKALELVSDKLRDGRGGEPITFVYRLRDPRGVVSGVSVLYRRRGEPAYSSLALQRRDDGTWSGRIAAEWTASATGFVAEYYATTVDKQGERLVSVGAADAPLALNVSAGDLKVARPVYKTAWFWTVLGVGIAATAAAATATALWYADASRPPQGDLPTVRLR